LAEWQTLTNREDVRFPYSYKGGGKTAENEKVIKKLRYIAKEVVYNIGKKLLSGNFNLTTVSFPIKAMVPKTILDNVVFSTCYYPLYLGLAMKTQDPVERFKMHLLATLTYFWAL